VGIVRQEAEPWQFPEASFRLLERVEAAIQPEDSALEDWFSRYCRQHRERLAADLHFIRGNVAPNARVLEYGAIPLVLTAALASLDYAVSALDIKPERFARSISNLGLEVIACDVETEAVPFEDATFDVVLFNELFEHLRLNPIFTFREVRRVLRPGGLLLLSTPNLRSLRGIRNLVFRNEGHAASSGVYQQYEKLETLGHMGHVREYTTREVSDFLRRSGFNVEKVVFRGGHGRGPVGIVEKLVPSLRPFFALVASKGESDKNDRDRGRPADLEGEAQ
jgi:SAM-dependent methyltransferase